MSFLYIVSICVELLLYNLFSPPNKLNGSLFLYEYFYCSNVLNIEKKTEIIIDFSVKIG